MLSDLFARNRTWAAARLHEDEHYFERLSALQRPEFLWIGCSDSRVPANVITGLEPGEVFVHRNVANLVHPGDLNLMSVLEYAVEALEVRHVIVCGHYGCGGVRAAADGQRHGVIDHWLQPIRETAEENASVLAGIEDAEATLDLLCELSVRSQVKRLARTPTMISARKSGRKIDIHGWIYGLRDGLLSDLQCT
jgi:carbonic anhydrase